MIFNKHINTIFLFTVIKKIKRIRGLNIFLFSFFFFLSSFTFSQFTDNFSDGDFTNNPAWSGDTAKFEVDGSFQLHLNAPAITDTAMLSVTSNAINNAVWEFFVRFDFNPSSTNFAKVFVVSNSNNFKSALNGYFVRVGHTADDISLFKKNGTTETLIIDGVDGRLNTAIVNVSIKLTRDSIGNWQLFSDTTGGNNYFLEGSGTETTFIQTSFFGVYCQYTSTRSDKFYFDNFNVTGTAFADTIPPVLNNISVISSTQLDLKFSEFISQTTAETLTNYSVNNGIGNPATAVRNAVDSSLVHLTFSNVFVNGVMNAITASNIQDLAGNTMVSDSQNFMYFVPVAAVYKDIVINEIYADINPLVGLPAAEFVEIYNRSSKTFDLSGWKFSDGSSTATLGSKILLPDSFLILCSTANAALYVPFGTNLGATSFPTLNDGGDNLTLSDSSATLIDAVSYSDSWYQDNVKKNGGWSLELINPDNPCTATTNWIASSDSSGGTPGKINSVYNITPDTQVPSLVLVSVISANTIELTFNEPMDSASLVNGTYTIDNGNSISAIVVSGNYSIVSLNLSLNIDTGIAYTVSANNVSDCSGNLIGANDSLQFLIGYTPSTGEVIFNEFMAKVTPNPAALPAKEYVELYNNSTKVFNLEDWQYNSKILTSFILLPDSYLILCSINDTALFSPYGNVLGLPSWPALSDAGASLNLADGNGNMIDALTYSPSWPGFTGGKSMELINPYNPCSGIANWIVSSDPSGGTPGKINSVYSTAADTTRPIAVGITVFSSNQIQVDFNETMDSASLMTGNFLISNGISVTGRSPSSDFTSVLLNISPALDSALVYSITISQVSDCPGNQILTQVLSLAIGVKPNLYDVIISEIFPNPNAALSSLPEAEFVELYNRTSKAINLSSCKFSDGNDIATINNSVIFPNEHLILCQSSSTDDFKNYGRTVGLSLWPSLNNVGDNLTLKDISGNIIHAVNYSETWYRNDVKKSGGWTLELINPDIPCGGASNWIASNDPSGGTPAKINSVYSNFQDTIPPEILEVKVITQNQIEIFFNETMDGASLANGTYIISDSLIITSILPVGPVFGSVLVNISPNLDSVSVYNIAVSNVLDCSGNPINTQSYFFALGIKPTLYNIIINEIFPDPDSSITGLPDFEFVELYNKTDSVINLNGCKFSDGSTNGTLNNAVIFPNEYLILCPSSNVSAYKNYGRTIGLSSWPGLNNAGDNLTLKDANGNLLHGVNYSDDWYGDEVKKKGGWTLELIDPNNPCGEENNWSASYDVSGGTPGKINSVNGTNPDNSAPQLEGAFAENTTTVKLFFNEITDSLSMLSATYSINNGINISSVIVLDKKTVQLNLSNSVQVKILYKVTVNGTSDCIGNLTVNSSAEFALAEKGVAGNIIINEILYDPRTGGAEFVEIYNNSDKVINLQNWSFARYPASSGTYIKTISAFPLVIFPKEYMLLTKDTQNIKKEYPLGKPENYFQVTLPSLTDSATIFLMDNDSTVSDIFSYHKSMHFALLKDAKGVSLERIDFNRSTNDAGNWHSAAESVGWATPGYQNSQYNPSEGDGSAVSIEPEIFSPDNDGFNDVVNIHYKFENPGFVATVQIYDAKGRLIKTITKSQILSLEGIFTWDGISDNNEKARIGIYVIYFEAFDLSGKILHFKKTCVVAGKMN